LWCASRGGSRASACVRRRPRVVPSQCAAGACARRYRLGLGPWTLSWKSPSAASGRGMPRSPLRPPNPRGNCHRLNGRPTAAACPGPASAGLPEARKPKEARLVRDDGPLRGGPAASPSGR
jgi:hypothetical protein